jgi:ribonuclease R
MGDRPSANEKGPPERPTRTSLEKDTQTRDVPPRRAAVIEALEGADRPLHAREIVTRLAVAARHEAVLGRVLDDLVFDGTVTALPGQRFRLAGLGGGHSPKRGAGREVEGFLSAHPRGFGFVPTEGPGSDVFVPAESLMGAMHGDRVVARIVGENPKGLEGTIMKIVARRNAKIPGVLRKRGKSSWVEPDDQRVRGPIVLGRSDGTAASVGSDVEAARDGDAVVARITRFPATPDEHPEGIVEAILGAPGDPEVEVLKILMAEGVEEDHDPLAVAEAEAFGPVVAQDAFAGRVDLTHLPLPTIDPIDARDHDDAIWAERNADGTATVWVAIADVSHYVTPGSALDASAVVRGCSIYLPDRAIPMLPRALSSNLCSLLPDETRLCLCVEMKLDANGTILEKRIVEGFMRSRAKLNYEGVANALGLSTEAPRQQAAVAMVDSLKVLREISTTLRGRRMARGALDLDLPEAKVVLEGRTPVDVVKRAKDPGVAKAYQIVEEFMLLANEAVASFLIEHDLPGIYRHHGPPDPEKLARLAELCERIGVDLEDDIGTDPKALGAFLKKTASHPRKQVLHMVLMRSMKQAVYDVTNRTHFGLASEGYVHFTSPIRRYPDIVVHRAVKAYLRSKKVDKSDQGMEAMRTAATLASERERRAMTIERQVVDLDRAIVMRDRVGEIFGGTVSGLSPAGAYVAIDEPFIDILVRAETLGSHSYEPDEFGLALVAGSSGDRVELGDAMMVQIAEVSITRRTVFGRRMRDEANDDEAPRGTRRERRGGRKVESPAAVEVAQERAAREARRNAKGIKRSGRSGPPPSAPPSDAPRRSPAPRATSSGAAPPDADLPEDARGRPLRPKKPRIDRAPAAGAAKSPRALKKIAQSKKRATLQVEGRSGKKAGPKASASKKGGGAKKGKKR